MGDTTTNAPVRHHYVPQFYLSAWCSPGTKAGEGNRVFVVENFDGQIKFTRRPTKATGFQDHLYSLSSDVSTTEPSVLETTFFAKLDDKGKVLVDKLVAGQRLEPDERGYWAMFVAAMRARTPDSIALVKKTGPEHVKLELGKGQSEYESLKEAGDPDTFLEWIDSRYPGLVENFSLSSLPRVLSGKIVSKINKMVWHTLDCQNGVHRLLSSDTPCVFTKGIDDSDCVIALPLSPRHAFLAFYPGSQAQAALTQYGPTRIAAGLNENVVSQAKSRAYCFSKGDAPENFYRKRLISRPCGQRSARAATP